MAGKVASPKYAWVIAVSGFLAGISTIIGMFVYGYNVPFIASDFGVTVADLAIATSLFGVLSSGLGFVSGFLGDRFGARVVITGGILALGFVLIAIGFLVDSPMMFIILYPIGGAFASALGSAVIPKLISSWFAPNMRAKGMVVNTLGGSSTAAVLGIVVPQVINAFGWRGCFEIMGCVLLVCGVVFFAICRNTPESMGTVPLGSAPDSKPSAPVVLTAEQQAAKKAESRNYLIRVLKMPITWLFGLLGVLWYCYFAGANAFQTAAIMDAGFDVTVAGLVSSALMVCIMCSQVIFSTLCDKFLSRRTWLMILCMTAGSLYVGFFFVLSSAGSSVAMLTVYACLIGLVSGHAAILQTLMAEVYPPELRATGPGVLTTITLVGTFSGPLIAAAVVNAAGGFNPAVFLFAGPCLFVAGLMAFFVLPRTGGKFGDPVAEAANTAQAPLSQD